MEIHSCVRFLVKDGLLVFFWEHSSLSEENVPFTVSFSPSLSSVLAKVYTRGILSLIFLGILSLSLNFGFRWPLSEQEFLEI